MIIDRTQQETENLLNWIKNADLPFWVEAELRDSLIYMMELHNEKWRTKKTQVKP